MSPSNLVSDNICAKKYKPYTYCCRQPERKNPCTSCFIYPIHSPHSLQFGLHCSGCLLAHDPPRLLDRKSTCSSAACIPVSFWQNCRTKDHWVKWQQRHCYCFPMHLQYRFAKCPYFREKEYLLKLNAGNVRWVLASVS